MLVSPPAPAVPTAAIAGTALLWVEQRPLGQAVIRAAPLPDTVAYVTVADSAGDFQLSDVPPGRYLLQAIQDQNNNPRAHPRQADDNGTVRLGTSASALV